MFCEQINSKISIVVFFIFSSKALLTFRSASLGDGAYHEIIQKFDGSVKVFHPTHNFLFPCPEDFGRCII